MKKTLKYLLKFAIGCAGIFWVVMMNRRALGIVNFGPLMDSRNVKSIVMEIWVGAASLYLIAQFGLYTMSLLKDPPVWVARFLDLGLVHYVKERYKLQMSARQQKVFSLMAWSSFVFLVVTLLYTIDAFSDSEMFLLNEPAIRAKMRSKFYELRRDTNLLEQALASERVRYFQFATEDNNVTKYLRDLYTIARDLKAAGAKVVVAELPEGSFIHASVDEGRPDLRTLRARIDSLNIVVWSRQWTPVEFNNFSPHVRLRLDESRVQTVYSVQKKMFSHRSNYWRQSAFRWQPLQRIDPVTRFPDYYPDAAILAARKFFDIPDTCALETDATHVRIGDLTIPVSSAGIAYADILDVPYFVGANVPVMAQRGILFADGYKRHSDSLRYVALYNRGMPPADTAVKDLLAYRSAYEGKAVLINWMPNNSETDFIARIPEASVLSSVLRRSFYTKLEWLTPALSLLSIALIALVSAFVGRARKIAYLSLLLMAGIMAVAVWLILSYRILFEPVYPVVACAISAVIFLLLKLARDAQIVSRSSLVSGDRRAPLL